uniref:Uncharacterized protein n=1 Tax=Arundo donax TaxID=35708 RepID=A0A0A9HBC5_ARUDO
MYQWLKFIYSDFICTKITSIRIERGTMQSLHDAYKLELVGK